LKKVWQLRLSWSRTPAFTVLSGPGQVFLCECFSSRQRIFLWLP
jgi:hypothetical protein